MPSQINPNKINPNFPAAGVNNNTQGFRNNAAGTVYNFNIAQTEISDLQNKTILTAPLSDGNAIVTNNLNTMPMQGGSYFDYSLAIVDHGTLTVTATEIFDFEQGAVHIATLNGSPAITTVAIQNFPNTGFSQLELQLTVTSLTHQLSFGNLTIDPSSSTPGYNSATNQITFRNIGNYNFVLSSTDNSTWFLTDQQKSAVAVSYTPSTPIGAAGDTAGLITYDSDHIYVCVSNYNGVTQIWRRATVTTW